MSKAFISLPKTVIQRSKYRILGLVGQGQFGRVFCAIHRKTGHLVALKELERQRFSTHKFLRELRFLLSLQHPNIVTCQAIEHTLTGRYLEMDYCEGGTLRNLIQSEVPLSLVQSLKLIADVLAGLEHAHSRGIVHCDIKPENILLNLDTTGWIARISDFGIARLSQELGSLALGETGSPAYMAPERFYGQYSPASDLYAVGILLFELIVGRRPFSGSPGELMSAHLNHPVNVPDTVPFLLRSTISTALQKLPARRFASAAEMLASIRVATEVHNLVQDGSSPISRPAVVLSDFSSLITQQEPLQAPAISLAVVSEQVYQASGAQVCCQTYASDALTGDILHQRQMQLNAPVEALMLRPQGCFVLTKFCQHNAVIYSIYCLPRTQTLASFSDYQTESFLEGYKLLSLECADLTTAIDPQGRWIAIVKSAITPDVEGNQTTFQILQLPNLQPVKPPVTCCFPSQLLALDSRYVMAISTRLGDEGTVFKIFNRRGSFIGALNLPMPLHLVTLSATFPYRLFAIEEKNPTSGLLIDLKPFRVFAIKLDIAPAFITATSWGYIMADRQGNIILLDPDGQRIGAFMVPAAPSAIATFEDYGMAIATWSGNQATLYRVDLRKIISLLSS
ncbi:MAG: serine/threonine protein kinase [Aphanothece sp. CMT-3BRIN-NPC111]|jgi:serine/threonine-protein kinase|nr:serine/threonine protein kinase [Aphanothece sp. CMT-3BRIN-NPC111]